MINLTRRPLPPTPSPFSIYRFVPVVGATVALFVATGFSILPKDSWNNQPFDVGMQAAYAIEPNQNYVALSNGTNITSPRGTRGRGTLRVINGTGTDAAVKLIDRDSGQTLRFVYVQARSEVTIGGISPCTCGLRFTTGSNWDANTRQFSQNPRFLRFPDVFEFVETQTADRVEWMEHTVTLHSVDDGNTQPIEISEREF